MKAFLTRLENAIFSPLSKSLFLAETTAIFTYELYAGWISGFAILVIIGIFFLFGLSLITVSGSRKWSKFQYRLRTKGYSLLIIAFSALLSLGTSGFITFLYSKSAKGGVFVALTIISTMTVIAIAGYILTSFMETGYQKQALEDPLACWLNGNKTHSG